MSIPINQNINFEVDMTNRDVGKYISHVGFFSRLFQGNKKVTVKVTQKKYAELFARMVSLQNKLMDRTFLIGNENAREIRKLKSEISDFKQAIKPVIEFEKKVSEIIEILNLSKGIARDSEVEELERIEKSLHDDVLNEEILLKIESEARKKISISTLPMLTQTVSNLTQRGI